MALGLLWVVFALLIATATATRALYIKFLSPSGAIAGFIVLSLSLLAGLRFGALLLTFFVSSAFLTKYGSEAKKKLDIDDYKEGGQYDWVQVLVNSCIATGLSLGLVFHTGWQDKCLDSRSSPIVTGLLGGILGHYACCSGDIWSSEIGVLSHRQPRLITTLRPVSRGTNGAVTGLGLLAATVGGTLIGLVFVVAGLLTTGCEGHSAVKQWLAIPLGSLSGLLGSLCDSLLGSTVQFSGFCLVRKKMVWKSGPTVRRIAGIELLGNNGVNFASALVLTLASAVTCLYIF